jgi:hypothetical protein
MVTIIHDACAGFSLKVLWSVGPRFLEISANGLITIDCLIIGEGEKVYRSIRLQLFMMPAQDLA